MRWWAKGGLVDTPDAQVALDDRGVLLGDGIFDTALVIGGQVVYGAAHLDRLARAAATLGIPFARTEAEAAWAALVEGLDYGSVRLTLTRGAGPRGIAPPATSDPQLYGSATAGSVSAALQPTTLWTSAIRRNDTSPTARLKTLGYLDAVEATAEAQRNGRAEPLFLNTQGRVACAGTGTLFVITNGTLATPPVTDGVLDGIVRARLLALAPKVGLKPCTTALMPGDLARAEALLVTNSLRLIAPVAALDDTEMPLLPPVVADLVRTLVADMSETTGVDLTQTYDLERLSK